VKSLFWALYPICCVILAIRSFIGKSVLPSFNKKRTMRPLYKDFITIARAIIEANYDDETFGCPELCKALQMSRSQVHRKLKKEVNLSLSEFIQAIRLEKAKILLKSTKHPINEIAYKVGYSDANYFSRSFSKIYGYPPSQCRIAAGS
jgi:AraC-like DNA-binding protein